MLRAASFLLAALVVPNAVFMLVEHWFFIQRAWVNLDYILLAGVWAWSGLGKRFLFAGFLAVALLDWLFAFAPAYHMSPVSALQGLGGAAALGQDFLALNALLLLVLAIGVAAASVAVMPRQPRRGSMVVAGALIAILVLLNAASHMPFTLLGKEFRLPNTATSTLNGLRVSLATAFGDAQANEPLAYGVASASRPAWDALGGGEDFVLIHVESLGLLEDAVVRQRVFKPMLDLASEQELSLQQGRVAFHGSTVAGELRELCGVAYPTVRPRIAGRWPSDCLPRLAVQRGMRTVAIHGFLGSFFSRLDWYPALGFEDSLFASDVLRDSPGLARCGSAFEGLCDDALLAHGLSLLFEKDAPVFLYLLTLTAHLPVLPVRDPDRRAWLCGDHPVLSVDPVSCDVLLRHHDLMRVLAGLLQSGLPRTATIVIVGDHPPPFLEATRRQLYSQDSVPFLRLRIPSAR